MKDAAGEIGSASDLTPAEQAVEELVEQWTHGEPSLEAIWARHGGTLPVLTALVKEDLRCRIARGLQPDAAS